MLVLWDVTDTKISFPYWSTIFHFNLAQISDWENKRTPSRSIQRIESRGLLLELVYSGRASWSHFPHPSCLAHKREDLSLNSGKFTPNMTYNWHILGSYSQNMDNCISSISSWSLSVSVLRVKMFSETDNQNKLNLEC